MKILVLGGMHGNEPLGIEVVRLLEKNPITNVGAAIANQGAVSGKVRFIKKDLNRSFPGESDSVDFETKRVAEILGMCLGYDIVLDFHNTHCPNNDCVFVGENANDNLFDLASYIDLKRLIVADYDCINKFASNCISVEISLSSKLMDAEFWYRRIASISKLSILPKASKLEKYKFVCRITNRDRDRLELEKKNLKAFLSLPKDLADALGVTTPAYPIFIGDGYTPYNYGGVLNRVK